jgi:polyisoprenoid-binding protein YceI
MLIALAFLAAAPELFLAYAPDSLVEFRVPFLKFNTVEGRFNRFAAAISYDPDLKRGSVVARVDAASLDSGFETRDKDLKSASFFEVDRYPLISFRSSKVERGGKGYQLIGELTLHGVTRTVSLNLEQTGIDRSDPNLTRLGFLARGMLSRSQFGVGKGPTAATISDEVEIEIRVSAQRQTWTSIPEKYPGDESKKNAAADAASTWSKEGARAGLARLRELQRAPGYDGSADQYIMLGAHLDSRGDASGAEQVFEACLEDFPRDARCPVRLAQAYAATGDAVRARKFAQRALDVDPQSIGALEILHRLG